MDLTLLQETCWWHFLMGYLFAVGWGGVLLWHLLGEMREFFPLGSAHHLFTWQPPVTGAVERTLYLFSFFADMPEFVGVWLALKVYAVSRMWTEDALGRALYSVSFTGSAMSLIYAVVGYIVAVWWDAYALAFATVLSVATVGLMWAVGWQRERLTRRLGLPIRAFPFLSLL